MHRWPSRFCLYKYFKPMRPVSLIAILTLLIGACSGSGESADGGRSADSTLRISLGTSGRAHIVTTAEDALLTRYGYRLNRNVNTGEDVRLETSWKDLAAFEDEKAAGIAEVRARITITARPRSRAGGTANTFSARMIVEVTGRSTPAADWAPVPITSERESYFDNIAEFLENEFKGGVM